MIAIILTVLAIIIFIAGCYYMGNFVLDSFHDDIIERLLASLYGVLCWCAIAVVVVICCGIYFGVDHLINVLK